MIYVQLYVFSVTCDTPNLFECNGERFVSHYTECVTSLIAKRGKSSPFVPHAGESKFLYRGKPGPLSGKHEVSYFFTENGPAKHGTVSLGKDEHDWVPFQGDKHRALILTQPKVGTGAIIDAFKPVSDLIIRSHEVEFLKVKDPWVPFPQCQAKPKLGNCTIIHGIRDPHSWLVSSYAQMNAEKICRFKGSKKDAIRSYFDWLSDPDNIASVIGWWRIGDQLRVYGMVSDQVNKFIGRILNSEGIAVLKPEDRPNQQPWIHGCQVVVLQFEKSFPGSISETKMRELVPGFHFKKNHLRREDLCPAGAQVYAAIKKEKLPPRILKMIAVNGSQRSQDFLAAIKAYSQ